MVDASLKAAAKAFVAALEAGERLQADGQSPSQAEIYAAFGDLVGKGAVLAAHVSATGLVVIRPSGAAIVVHGKASEALEIPTVIDLREPVAPPLPPEAYSMPAPDAVTTDLQEPTEGGAQ